MHPAAARRTPLGWGTHARYVAPRPVDAPARDNKPASRATTGTSGTRSVRRKDVVWSKQHHLRERALTLFSRLESLSRCGKCVTRWRVRRGWRGGDGGRRRLRRALECDSVDTSAPPRSSGSTCKRVTIWRTNAIDWTCVSVSRSRSSRPPVNDACCSRRHCRATLVGSGRRRRIRSGRHGRGGLVGIALLCDGRVVFAYTSSF